MAFPINSAQSAPAVAPVDQAESQLPADNGAQDQPTFEIKLKVNQSEVDEAVSALREAGLDTFADLLANAMPKPDSNAMDATSQGLQDDIVAMQPRN